MSVKQDNFNSRNCKIVRRRNFGKKLKKAEKDKKDKEDNNL